MERNKSVKRHPNKRKLDTNSSVNFEVKFTNTTGNSGVKHKLRLGDYSPKRSSENKMDLRWLDKWDVSSLLLENVDLANRQSAFNIPMVDVTVSPSLHLSLTLSYTGSDASVNGPLGFGWNLHNTQEYIVLDHKQSMFPENHEYQLFLEGQQTVLKRRLNAINTFFIDGEDDINVTYEEQQQRWIVDTPYLTSTYGRSDSGFPALQWSLSWPNWRGPGRSESGLRAEVVAWYLVSREEKHGAKQKLYYRYLTEERKTPSGNGFTSTILLESISDASGEHRMELHYARKSASEYIEKNIFNVDGTIVFPIPMTSKHHLTRCTLGTPQFQQNIIFQFSVEGSSSTLSKIKQSFNQEMKSAEETIFEFSYRKVNDKKILLKNLSIPSYQSSIIFDYEKLEIPLLRFQKESLNTLTYPSVGNVQINQGGNYGVMAYDIGLGGIYTRLFNKQLTQYTKDIFTCPDGIFRRLDDLKSAEEDPYKIERYAIMLFPDLITVLEDFKDRKRLNLFHRQNGTIHQWPDCPTQSIVLPKDCLFRYSDSLMAVAWNTEQMSDKITVIEPIENDKLDENNVEKGFEITDIPLNYNTKRNITRMAIQGERILAYDEYYLTGFKKTEDGKWKEFWVGYFPSEQSSFFDRFILEDDMKKSITEQITLNGLHNVDNMLLLSTINFYPSRNTVETKAHLLLVDDNFSVVKSHDQVVFSEDLLAISEKQELNDRTVFEFMYKYQIWSKKYEGYLHNVTGTMIDENCKDMTGNKLEDCRGEIIKAIQDQNKDDFAKIVIFDPEPFMTFQLEQYSARTKTKKLNMMGDYWQWTDLTNITNMRLSSGYVLESRENKDDGETSYALYRQNPASGGPSGDALHRFVIGGNGNMAVGFPSYIAVQTDVRYQPELTLFRELGEEIDPILLGDRGEQILRMSNHEILVTIRNSSDPNLAPFDKEVVIRRVNSVVPSTPMWVLARTEARYMNESRVRTYESTFNCNDDKIAQENTVRVIPTGNSSISGWYEERSILPIEDARNATKTQNWYDASGNLVLVKEVKGATLEQEQEEKNQADEDERDEKQYKIFDSSGQLEIADISPYNITENMVAYFGFEVYERNLFQFEYPVTRVIPNEFPFTGERLLRLRPKDKITGMITPDHQKGSYIASTWVRPQTTPMEYVYDSPVQYFKAHLATHTGTPVMGLHGQMKRTMESWIYLEIAVDLDKIRNNVYSEIYRHSRSKGKHNPFPVPLNTNFTIQVEIDYHGEEHLDVDHIRFAPAQLDLSVSVYNSQTGVETETIQANGGVLKKIFDQSGAEIASIGEDGNIEQLKSSSKSGITFPTPTALNAPSLEHFRKEIIIVPESGRYESFDKYSVENRWILDGEQGIWAVSKGTIFHGGNATHHIVAKSPETMFDANCSAVRFFVKLLSPDAILSVSLFGYDKIIQVKADGTLTVGENCRKVANLPTAGELIFHVEEQTIWLWFNGMLIADRKLSRGCISLPSLPNDRPWSHFQIEVGGDVEISNVLLLTQPQITVEYQNGWGDRTQVIQLEDAQTALVTETIYDEMGRDAIKTKTARIRRAADNLPLLHYYPDFVTNRNPSGDNSIFKTGICLGLLSQLNPLDEGYPYSRSIFHDDMLREVKIEGMPGKAYAADGSFTKSHGRNSGILFLKILFPPEHGFREKVTYEPNGSVKVTVLDKGENEVAEYVKVAGFDNILSINEYDKEGNLLKIVPPEYHLKMNTFLNRTTPWNFGDDKLSAEEKHWQSQLATHFEYDSESQLIQKKTPDLGFKGYIYDMMGNLRFMYNLKSSNESMGKINDLASDIIYLVNIGRNKPVEIGYIKDTLPLVELKAEANSTAVFPSSFLHQRITYSNSHSDPELRGKLKLFLTYNYDHSEDPTMRGMAPPHQEILKFNSANHVIMKTSNAVHSGSFTNYMKHYSGGKLRELQHPPEEGNSTRSGGLNLIYKHDKMGRLTSLGSRTNPNQFVQLGYNAAGQVESEILEPGTEHEILRHYEYDSAGLLTKIEDAFISQKMSFIEGGYGQSGFGDGIISQNVFNSSWSTLGGLDEEQKKWFRLPVEEYEDDKLMQMCFTAMQRLGIVDKETLVPLKFLTQSMLSTLPMPCAGSTGHTLMKLVASHFPMSQYYGHRYAYGNHQELVKAKFFGDDQADSVNNPLQVVSFLHEIEQIEDPLQAESIWDLLVEAGYLIVDNGKPDDKLAAIGKQGRNSMFRYTDLQRDLNGISNEYGTFAGVIMTLLYNRLLSSPTQSISLEEFQIKFVEWHGYLDMETPLIIINRAKAAAQKIYEMMSSKGYVSSDLVGLLASEYLAALEPHKECITEITRVLISHFKSQIGSNIFDYESYRIDPNGNHQMYYVGFNRHQLEYLENTNKVNKIIIQDPYAIPGEDETVTELEHDTQGNVCTARHRGVEKIKYHPVINRPTFMELTDGRRITIKYDAQGERLLKRVYTAGLKLISEVKYLRDEHGAVLMDKRVTFDENGVKVKELNTTYLYGPRKTILGFIRNGKFYSVFTDHAGSIRLVIHKGRVVAGYDYWPYGEMMKQFGEEDAQIMYRFTGQEYDPETGLYNYHARIYDPTIGRFFQPDPKSQYFSPYVYGGNSPISLVDPDGEFFFTLMTIIGAVVGAYLAAAAANGSFNPAKWDWKSGKTWLALIGGGIGGYMLPGSFVAVAAQIGTIPAILVGVGGAYIKAAIQNKSWNPGDWNWADPATYNAFLEGFSSGLSTGPDMISNVKNLHKFAKNFSKLGQVMVYGGAILAGTGLALLKGAMANDKNFKFWQWDFKDPATLSAIFDGFNSGIGLPQKGHDMYKNFAKMNKDGNFKNMLDNMKGSAKKFFTTSLKDKKHPLYKALGKAVVAYVMVAIDSETIDFTKWDWKSRSTYEGILNGWKVGPDILDMHNTYKEGLTSVKGNLHKFRGEKKQQDSLLSFAEELANSMNDLTEFFLGFPLPVKRGNGRKTMIPIALKMFASLLSQEKNINEVFEDKDFQNEMQQMLSGLRAGAQIIPTVASNLEKIVDCSNAQDGVNEDGFFQTCNIANFNGKTSLKNRELIKSLFVPSTLYQSKTEFISVKPSDEEPTDFVEKLFELISTNLNAKMMNEDFLFSMFTGAVYNSLLNNGNSTDQSFYYRAFEMPQEQVNVLHIANLKNEEQEENKTLFVRSVIIMSSERFSEVKEELEGSPARLRFECYLPTELISTVNVIQAESIVIATTAGNTTQVNILTPDYSPDPTSCSGDVHKFSEIPTPTPGLHDHFKNIMDPQATTAQKSQNYRDFLSAFLSDFDQVFGKTSTCRQCLTGYLFGLLAFNMQHTYELSLDQAKSSKGTYSLSVAAKRDAQARQTLQATPLLFHVGDELEDTEESPLTYKLTMQSLAKNALLGKITIQDNSRSISVSQTTLPSYEGGIFGMLFLRDANKLKKLVQYLYHSHYFVRSSVPNQGPVSSTNQHFISNFVLGELHSRMEDSSVEIHVFVPGDSASKLRLSAQRIFFIKNLENGRCTILNIIESSSVSSDGKHYEFDANVAMDIPSIPDVDITSLQIYEMHLNVNSNSGWTVDDAGAGTSEGQVFFQSVTVISADHRRIPKNNAVYLKLEPTLDSLSTIGQIAFNQEYISKTFSTLKNNRLQNLINTDTDFQSVFMGLLTGSMAQVSPDSDGISLTMRKFITARDSTSPALPPLALSLLSISNDGTVVPQTEQVLMASLKSAETGEEEEIEEKMEEAKEQLKTYYCTREAKLKEAFMQTKLPAVYNSGESSENGDRIIFEVDPRELEELNCTAPENPFRDFLRDKKEDRSSGGGTTSSSFFGDGFSKWLYGTGQQNTRKIPDDTHLDGCHLGAWVNGEGYSIDGIVCSSGKSKVAVFRHIESNDLVQASSRGQPFSLVGDNYKKEKCVPLNYNGRHAVACEGEKTTLIYTPYYEPRLFDELDGNLMLGRIALHLGRKLWKFVTGKTLDKVDDKHIEHLVSEEMMMGWERDTVGVQSLLSKWKGADDQVGWAKVHLVEIRELLEKIKVNDFKAMPEMIEEVTERLAALQEDLAEQILFASAANLAEQGQILDGEFETETNLPKDQNLNTGQGNFNMGAAAGANSFNFANNNSSVGTLSLTNTWSSSPEILLWENKNTNGNVSKWSYKTYTAASRLPGIIPFDSFKTGI